MSETVPEKTSRGDAAPETDFTQRMCASFLVGEYLAVNALRDLYLLVEGPDCAHIKTQYVQGSHDWCSNLTGVSGFHRIANTALHPDQMGESREQRLRESMLAKLVHQEFAWSDEHVHVFLIDLHRFVHRDLKAGKNTGRQ